jgi:hypothetical protein
MRKMLHAVGLVVVLFASPQVASAYCCQVACSGPVAWVACSSDGTCPSGPCEVSTSMMVDATGTCGEGPSPNFGFYFTNCPRSESNRCADQVDNDAWVAGDAGTDCTDVDCCGDSHCPGSCGDPLCANAPQCNPAPAPAVSTGGIAAAVMLLVLIGSIAILRRRRHHV